MVPGIVLNEPGMTIYFHADILNIKQKGKGKRVFLQDISSQQKQRNQRKEFSKVFIVCLFFCFFRIISFVVHHLCRRLHSKNIWTTKGAFVMSPE